MLHMVVCSLKFMRNAEFMVVKPHSVAMIQTPSGVYSTKALKGNVPYMCNKECVAKLVHRVLLLYNTRMATTR